MALIWTAAEQASAQALLLSNAQGTDSSVQACTGISSTDKSSWTTFYTALQGFCAQVPANFFPTGNEVLQTSGLYDQLEVYQRQLYAWQQKLSKTCSISVPVVDPTTPPSGVENITKYLAIGAVALGAAWIASSLVSETKLFTLGRVVKQTRRV
jgi:hypothetical protein